jgi:hypothetical protein
MAAACGGTLMLVSSDQQRSAAQLSNRNERAQQIEKSAVVNSFAGLNFRSPSNKKARTNCCRCRKPDAYYKKGEMRRARAWTGRRREAADAGTTMLVGPWLKSPIHRISNPKQVFSNLNLNLT